MMNKFWILLAICCGTVACQSPDLENDNGISTVSAVDISSFIEINESGPSFFNTEGQEEDFLDILQASGINTIRLRLWIDPLTEHSSLAEVSRFAENLKSLGFDIWLCLHYSSTWAHPGQQITPDRWQNLSQSVLIDSVFSYTSKVMRDISPDYIQLGNELNTGFLHPQGELSTQPNQFIDLLESGIDAVRANSTDTKIMLHFAGIEGADWFYKQVSDLDYDIIGLSYYPIWHGKSLENLRSTMTALSTDYDKDILIAETAYPFTLEWNDWTHNIVGLQDQLLDNYPATPSGQAQYIADIKSLTQALDRGLGVCYWGAELISWKGEESTEGSPWENQALFDFENTALPVLQEF